MPTEINIPYQNVVPSVGPGHDKQAKSVMVIDMQAGIIYSGLYAAAGRAPFGQTVSRFGVAIDHSEQRFTAFEDW